MENDQKQGLKAKKVNVLGMAITKPWPQAKRKSVDRSEKFCVPEATYRLNPVAVVHSGGMDQNSSKI